MDEQNIESSHPQFNQLLRSFRNSRGSFCQKKMITKFVFSHSTWMTNTIDEMLKSSDRGKYKTKKTHWSGQRATNASQRRGARRGRGAPLPPPQDSMELMGLTRRCTHVNNAIRGCSDLQWPYTIMNCTRCMNRKRVRPSAGKNKVDRARVRLTIRSPREETSS